MVLVVVVDGHSIQLQYNVPLHASEKKFRGPTITSMEGSESPATHANSFIFFSPRGTWIQLMGK